jgi:hypothetical protein
MRMNYAEECRFRKDIYAFGKCVYCIEDFTLCYYIKNYKINKAILFCCIYIHACVCTCTRTCICSLALKDLNVMQCHVQFAWFANEVYPASCALMTVATNVSCWVKD